MKTTATITFTLFLTCFIASCVKCVECTYTNRKGEPYTSNEFCGKNETTEKFIESCKRTASDSGGVCTCK